MCEWHQTRTDCFSTRPFSSVPQGTPKWLPIPLVSLEGLPLTYHRTVFTHHLYLFFLSDFIFWRKKHYMYYYYICTVYYLGKLVFMAINNYFRCNENKISLMLLGDKYLGMVLTLVPTWQFLLDTITRTRRKLRGKERRITLFFEVRIICLDIKCTFTESDKALRLCHRYPDKDKEQ